jgi:hypothetical protein
MEKKHIKNLMNSLLPAILVVFLFLNNWAYASVRDDYLPQEILLLKLPNNEAALWKSIYRIATTKEGLVEYIPSNQTSADWVDLIAIQYFDLSDMELNKNSFNEILDSIKQTTITKYPDCKVTWNVIEKKQEEATYEWILHCKSGEIPPQHEIVRIFYHANKIHRIGFTHKNEMINAADRNKWIQQLSESVSFISQANPKFPSEELSLITRSADLIDYGSNFTDWQEINNLMFKNVHNFTIIPPGHNEGYVTECVEIMSMPKDLQSKVLTMDKVFQVEKIQIKKKLGKEPKIQILEKSLREIVFTYHYPHNNLIVTNIVRVRVTPNTYLSIHYKKGLSCILSNEEILAKKKQIETLKYKK